MPKPKTKAEFIKLLDARVRQIGTQTAFAEKFGLKQQYVSKLLQGIIDPGPQILDVMGYERIEVTYREKAK